MLLIFNQFKLPAIICCTGELCKIPLFIFKFSLLSFFPSPPTPVGFGSLAALSFLSLDEDEEGQVLFSGIWYMGWEVLFCSLFLSLPSFLYYNFFLFFFSSLLSSCFCFIIKWGQKRWKQYCSQAKRSGFSGPSSFIWVNARVRVWAKLIELCCTFFLFLSHWRKRMDSAEYIL